MSRALELAPQFAGLASITLIAVILLASAGQFHATDVEINLASELLGTAMVGFALSPLLLAFGRRMEAAAQRRDGAAQDFIDFQYDRYIEWVKDARHRIRIMDTASSILSPRDTDDERVRQLRKATIEALKSALRRGTTIQVRLYESLPGIAYYGADNDAMVAFFMPDRISDQSQHLDFAVDSAYGRITTEYFERVWSNSTDFLDYLYPTVWIDSAPVRTSADRARRGRRGAGPRPRRQSVTVRRGR